jgi:hypothetical protein
MVTMVLPNQLNKAQQPLETEAPKRVGDDFPVFQTASRGRPHAAVFAVVF